MSNRTIYGLLVVGNLFWGCSFPFTKLVTDHMTCSAFIFFRFLLAVVILGTFTRVVPGMEKPGIADFKKYGVKGMLSAFVSGFLGIYLYQFFFFQAMERTTAISASIIGALNPVLTIIIGALFAHQYINKKMAAGVGISFVGAVLTVCGGNILILRDFQLNSGDLLMVTGTFVWAVYNVYCKCRCAHIPPVTLTFYNFLAGMICALPLALRDKPWEWIGQVPLTAWLALLFLTVCASIGAYCIQLIGIQKIGPGRTSIFVNLMPFFSMIVSVLLLGEKLEPVKVLTALIIVAGVVVCQKFGENSVQNQPEKDGLQKKS